MAVWQVLVNALEVDETWRLEKDGEPVIEAGEFVECIEKMVEQGDEGDSCEAQLPWDVDVTIYPDLSFFKNAWGVAGVEEGGVAQLFTADVPANQE